MDEHQIKMRYAFAMTAFSRMFGPKTVNASVDIHRFCHKWSESDEKTPEGTLVNINFYFKDRWDAWGGHV